MKESGRKMVKKERKNERVRTERNSLFESFVYDRHRSKHFTWVILFYPRKRENDRLERQEGEARHRETEKQKYSQRKNSDIQRDTERNQEP